METAQDAAALLASMEADGELTGKDSMPKDGGHVTRIYTKARK
ncbi:MAG TPA: hypothetical protein VFY06_12570 [Verrucomicrobiae bacterium]|nr:hypothetical protein [Verrucomicrobiae bacterium]